MILTDARTRVRSLIDDADSELWTDAEVDASLASAQYEALLWAVVSGCNLFTQEADITTTSAGLADLSSLKPMKIVNVAQVTGTSRFKIPPIQLHDIAVTHAVATTLKVAYVARPTFPASGAAAFVWSSASISCPPLDQYMVCLAAAEMKVKEGEEAPGLDKRKAELRDAILSLVNVPGWHVRPMRKSSSNGLGIAWAMTSSDQLQLVQS